MRLALFSRHPFLIFQHRFEIAPGVTVGVVRHVFGRARCDYLATAVTALFTALLSFIITARRLVHVASTSPHDLAVAPLKAGHSHLYTAVCLLGVITVTMATFLVTRTLEGAYGGMSPGPAFAAFTAGVVLACCLTVYHAVVRRPAMEARVSIGAGLVEAVETMLTLGVSVLLVGGCADDGWVLPHPDQTVHGFWSSSIRK